MRIAGITIPDTKRLEIGLTELYGVGRSRALRVLSNAQVDPGKKPKELTPEEEKLIRSQIEGSEFNIEGDLRRATSNDIKRLKDIKCWRGDRHARGMTVRGQRTQRNFRTVPSGISAKHKGRKTMGSGRVKVEKK